LYADIISQRGGDDAVAGGPGSFADYLRKAGKSGASDAGRRARWAGERPGNKGFDKASGGHAETGNRASPDRGSEAEVKNADVKNNGDNAKTAQEKAGEASAERASAEKAEKKRADAKAEASSAAKKAAAADEDAAEKAADAAKEAGAEGAAEAEKTAEAKDAAEEARKADSAEAAETARAARNAEAAARDAATRETGAREAAAREDSAEETAAQTAAQAAGEEPPEAVDGKSAGLMAAESAEGKKAAAQQQGHASGAVSGDTRGRGGETGSSRGAMPAATDGSGEKARLSVVDARSRADSGDARNGGKDGGENGGGKGAAGGARAGAGQARAEAGDGTETGRAVLNSLKSETEAAAGTASRSGTSTALDGEVSADKVQMIRVDTAAAAGRQENGSGWTPAGAKTQSPLLRQLQEQLNGEVVKRAGIVVRDNGNGEIRLNLKPEHLGSVRIRLTLEDSHIVGKIFVENSSIREVFEQNVQNLQRAFKEHGYESASLEVSVGDGKHQRKGEGKQPAGDKGPAQAIRTLEESVPEVSGAWGEEQLVDLVV
jgi:flagellar hook-length control protein FliK